MTIQASLEHDFSWFKPLKGLRAKLTYSKNVNNSKRNDIKMENVVYRMINRGGSGKHLYITDPAAIIDNDPLVDYDEVTLERFPYVAFENFQKRTLNEGSKSYLSRTMSTSNSYQLNFMLMYMRDFGKHHVSGTFSIERGESESEDVEAKGTHPLSFTDGQSNSLSDDSEKTVQWGRQEGGSLAYIGRINYAYADKYLFEFLIRSQASTKFSPKNYWGAFPSVSAGWVILVWICVSLTTVCRLLLMHIMTGLVKCLIIRVLWCSLVQWESMRHRRISDVWTCGVQKFRLAGGNASTKTWS